MNRFAVILASLFCTFTSLAVEPGSFEEKASRFTWEITPDPALPNVLIIGDSISIGYTLQLRALLKGKANVYRPIKKDGPDNCGDAAKGVNAMNTWLELAPKWDLIHFNFGLHDLKRIDGKKSNPTIPPRTSIPVYKERLTTIVNKLKPTKAKLIFATTTDYPAGVTPCRLPADAVQYNSAAREVMTAHSVAINDLYAFTKGRLPELQIPKNVHFTEEGSGKLAVQIANRISTELNLGLINTEVYLSYRTALDAGMAHHRNKQYNKAREAYTAATKLAKSAAQAAIIEKKLAALPKK